MKKQILSLILGICLLVSVSAISISGGETYYKDLTSKIENLQSFECNLTSQTYNLDGANFTTNSTGYIISLDLNFRPDNLTVNCILNGEKYISSGGGGSSKIKSTKTSNCFPEYVCGEFNECSELGIQKRICVKVEGSCLQEEKLLKTIKNCEYKTESCEDTESCGWGSEIEEIIKDKIDKKKKQDRNQALIVASLIILFLVIIGIELRKNYKEKNIKG